MENTEQLNRLKYPIGPFVKKEEFSVSEFETLINDIETSPSNYRKLTENLSSEELLKTYREGSWNIQQLVHHVADIQMLHFLRLKKALTEPNYNEVTLIDMDAWVITPDGLIAPIEDSLLMFEGITNRYVFLIKSLDKKSLDIEYFHPVRKYTINQAQAVSMSAWHVKHHLAHIKQALEK